MNQIDIDSLLSQGGVMQQQRMNESENDVGHENNASNEDSDLDDNGEPELVDLDYDQDTQYENHVFEV
ncbi:hypothetical protein PanWU01x14_166110 [Parasponia andersonii]|uniref:Uncharacterized protein n=1 Tax=Parasponia andersonii TaxID=3476 RepID=A0A2P5CBG6_PARAD|nr:hypothetical protein PanWU01x14_166110 [Parasponia andersonii]